MPKYIDADEYIKYCEENWIALNVDAVNKQPEADVEPKRKTGRWIDLDDHLLCSSCGASHTAPDKNYCPNCGAKMDKEEDDGIL